MDVVSLEEHHDKVDQFLMAHQEKDAYIQRAGSPGLFFKLLVSETAWNPGHAAHQSSRLLLCLGGGGGTPLQEPNGDVPLDGVAFSQLQ